MSTSTNVIFNTWKSHIYSCRLHYLCSIWLHLCENSTYNYGIAFDLWFHRIYTFQPKTIDRFLSWFLASNSKFEFIARDFWFKRKSDESLLLLPVAVIDFYWNFKELNALLLVCNTYFKITTQRYWNYSRSRYFIVEF